MIYSGNTTLRAPLDSDVSFFATLRNDLDMQSMLMSRARGNTEEQVSEWLRTRSTQPDAVFFVIASKSDDKPIGFVQLTNIDNISQCGELGICLCTEQQGQNHATNTLTGFETYLLITLNITKIVLTVLRRIAAEAPIRDLPNQGSFLSNKIRIGTLF